MRVSVGLLYSATALHRMIDSGEILTHTFPAMFPRFEAVTGQAVLDLSLALQWTHYDPTGKLVLSPRSKDILAETSDERVLRLQLIDVVELLRLPWATSLHSGRKEAEAGFSGDISQIFKEAGLMSPNTDDDVVAWWDAASQVTRSWRSASNGYTGRQGERLKIGFEKRRTGLDPQWQALESNRAGYDVLSVEKIDNPTRLLIEVKASIQKFKEATFVVSRHEWVTASQAMNYCFHLWSLTDTSRLWVVPAAEVNKHAPADVGDGRWNDVRIPFKAFSAFETPNLT